MYNTEESIQGFASSCFEYALQKVSQGPASPLGKTRSMSVTLAGVGVLVECRCIECNPWYQQVAVPHPFVCHVCSWLAAEVAPVPEHQEHNP
jgi:hypothetical protein